MTTTSTAAKFVQTFGGRQLILCADCMLEATDKAKFALQANCPIACDSCGAK